MRDKGFLERILLASLAATDKTESETNCRFDDWLLDIPFQENKISCMKDIFLLNLEVQVLNLGRFNAKTIKLLTYSA